MGVLSYPSGVAAPGGFFIVLASLCPIRTQIDNIDFCSSICYTVPGASIGAPVLLDITQLALFVTVAYIPYGSPHY